MHNDFANLFFLSISSLTFAMSSNTSLEAAVNIVNIFPSSTSAASDNGTAEVTEFGLGKGNVTQFLLAQIKPNLKIEGHSDQHKKTIHVGPYESVRTISEAASLAKDGDIIEIEPGDYYGDVAIWTQDRITIRAARGRVRLVAAGANADGKGIWVVRGGDIVIENIDFFGARVADRNGAGIRFEKGNLLIRNCSFIDNENGILSGGGDSSLQIENSEFANNGAGDGQSHNLYIGAIKKLKITGSYFHHAKVGHLLKSRARENFILNNRLTDEIGGHASYEMEFPAGGIVYVIGNIIEQSSTTENSTMISVGAEGYFWPHNELYLASNTIIDDRPSNGVFLRVKPGINMVKAINNLLVGKSRLESTERPSGIKEKGKEVLKFIFNLESAEGSTKTTENFINNFNVEWDQLAQPARYDYRIKSDSNLIGKFLFPGLANGISLSPDFEYVHPRNIQPLSKKPTMPGALQTLSFSVPKK